MPQYPISQGVIFSVGLYGGGEHFQCVMPLIYENVPGAVTVKDDLIDWFENVIVSLWQPCLASDMELTAIQAESFANAAFVPLRKVYPRGTWPGTEGAESYSQNASMLISFHSTDQAGSGARVRTGKSFIGPPPESKCVNRTIDAAFVTGALNSLALALLAGFIGVSSGVRFRRALAADAITVGGMYSADQANVRANVYTQKRRLSPIL